MRNGRPCILLVDGNDDRRARMKELLERQIYDVPAQKDGKQAMDYLKSHAFEVDLVLTDLDLHSLNGSGLDLMMMMRITEKIDLIPAVLIIHSGDDENLSKALEAGAEDVLTFEMDERLFLRRIKHIISFVMKHDYVNVVEESLEKTIMSHAKDLGICLCRACKNDVLTLALNNLQPRYVSSEKGRILASVDQLNRDYVPQLLRVITEAAEKIKKNPRHQI